MRYEKGHKQATRERVIAVAARRFRKDGIEATGIAALMKDAGLTHGGFYAHFTSKEDLVAEAAVAALQETRLLLERADQEDDDKSIEALVDAYLSPHHRDRADRGCALAAMAAEIARHSSKTRTRLDDHICDLLSSIAGRLPAKLSQQARSERAKAVFCVMLGALQLSRTIADRETSDSFLRAGRGAALSLANAEHVVADCLTS
jgi:TetR/AcrR family transcriptional regulator, transcriptional repressor for nem operon